MAQEQTFEISDGPSKFDVMVSLMDRANVGSDKRRSAKFTVAHGAASLSIKVFINSLEREDGSGESWLFKAHIDRTEMSLDISRSTTLQQFARDLKAVHGYYNMRTRHGWIAAGYAFEERQTPWANQA
jgi:hypothetical protein